MPNVIAFAEFVWDYVSIPDEAELKSYDIFDCMWNPSLQDPLSVTITKFCCVSQFYSSSPPKKKCSIAKFPETLLAHTDCFMLSKSSVSTDRKRLAHPDISQKHLEIFLQRLGLGDSDGTPNQDPLDIALFKHLKTTSISEENVERAARTREGEMRNFSVWCFLRRIVLNIYFIGFPCTR